MSQNTELKAQAKKPGLNKKGIAAWINNYSFILIALAIFIAYLFINHGATTWSGVMNILRHSAVVGIMAFGMGLVIITGGIDLSVGSMLALVGSFSVVVFNATDSVFLTLLFALVAGGLCGLFNGVLIGLVKMPAFIVTLATMLIFRSVAQYYLVLHLQYDRYPGPLCQLLRLRPAEDRHRSRGGHRAAGGHGHHGVHIYLHQVRQDRLCPGQQ